MKNTSLTQTPAEWLQATGTESSIVISSRLRLARNVEGFAFPTWAKKTEREKVWEQVRPVVEALPQMKNPSITDSMDHFTVMERQILVEQHLISREHAAKNAGSGVVVNAARDLSIMINEEDHLRIQTFKAGLDLQGVWEKINEVDSALENNLRFAFSPQYGYLTACPTNVGTGMRASAMLHLPGLVLAEDVNRIVQAVGKLNLAVRGLYGEGTEALGNLFQVSNQMTLGESEESIIKNLNKVIVSIVEHEENARAKLLEQRPRMVADRVGRAFGVLTNAHSMTSKEALDCLSILRLGTELGLLPRELRPVIDDLMITSQPAHLQVGCDQKLSAENRDGLRADQIREKLSTTTKPDTQKLFDDGLPTKEKHDE